MLLTRSVTRMSSVGSPRAAPISTSSGLRLLRSEPEKTLWVCCVDVDGWIGRGRRVEAGMMSGGSAGGGGGGGGGDSRHGGVLLLRAGGGLYGRPVRQKRGGGGGGRQ